MNKLKKVSRMKVIKKINNNVAICLDSNDKELIAFGKGIGFPKMPYVLDDLNLIQRTYYGVSQRYLNLLNDIPDEIFEISTKIVDYAQTKLEYTLNSNVVFTLADHINFAIQRFHKNIQVKVPLSYDVEFLYEKEMDIGKKAIKYINKTMGIRLSSKEATGIALHFINVLTNESIEEQMNTDDLLQRIIGIIEKELKINIDTSSFSYSRFATHVEYLLKRIEDNVSIDTKNHKMYENITEKYPESYQCALKIQEYLNQETGRILNDEELLYLIIHMNRLSSREDCRN